MTTVAKKEIRQIVREELLRLRAESLPAVSATEQREIETRYRKSSGKVVYTPTLEDYIRLYKIPSAKATAEEKRLIEAGRKDFAKGKFYSLSEVLNDLDRKHSRQGKKKSRSRRA